MSTLISILISNLIISAGAFIGLFTISLNVKRLNNFLLPLVALSAGTLIGDAFLHLLPEAAEQFPDSSYLYYVLGSFIGFFLIEKLLHWRHCHHGECEIHEFGYLNLIGDAIHNFIDGLFIAAAFVTDFNLGVVTSIAIALHEIPQEISDFGVLLYAGFSKPKALLANLLVALTAVAGGVIGYLLSFQLDSLITILLPIAAGGFLYIATSDLMPEINKETNLKKSILSFSIFLLGIAFMYVIKIIAE